MKVVQEICCGIEVHAKMLVACLLLANGEKEIRTFSTTTDELLRMRDWLMAAHCTHVAIESTGIYWKPVFNILEDALTVILINPEPAPALRVRKTDVKDAELLADLLRPGLLKASFIPPPDIRELIGPRVAEVVAAEIGVEMKAVFESDAHLASWAGICPGNKASGGKRLSGRTRKGNPYLRAALVPAAWGATMKTNCYLSSQYYRLVKRLGRKKALVAVAHSLLVISHHVLERDQTYTELGGDYFDRHHVEQQREYFIRKCSA